MDRYVVQFLPPFHKSIEHTKENAERANGERLLGKDPASGEPLYVKLGKYGPIAQIGETSDETKKPKFASLKEGQHIKTISLEEALKLFDYPKSLGEHENLEVTIKVGRFGPYIQFGTENVSIPKGIEPDEVLLENAIVLINEKEQQILQLLNMKTFLYQKEKADLDLLLNGMTYLLM